jgi:cell division protein FtsL
MLRTNLATRPFYNERLVHVGLWLAAVLVAAATVVNVRTVRQLRAEQARLMDQAARDEAAARQLAGETAALTRQLRAEELGTLTAAAREANALIERRTFSWTALFNHLETTLPADVMLTAVRPEVQEGTLYVQMSVLGRRLEAIDAFMERLEATGAFADLLARQEEKTEEGLYRAMLRGRYLGAQR